VIVLILAGLSPLRFQSGAPKLAPFLSDPGFARGKWPSSSTAVSSMASRALSIASSRVLPAEKQLGPLTRLRRFNALRDIRLFASLRPG